MERGDLLSANGAIFTGQGKALNDLPAGLYIINNKKIVKK